MSVDTTAPSREEQHDAISRVAARQGFASSFRNGVSIHRIQLSSSFNSLKEVLAASQHEHKTFIGTLDGQAVVSVNFNYQPPQAIQTKTKKRGRDSDNESVQAAIDRVRNGLTSEDDVNETMLEHARGALYALLTKLRGAQNESVVESWGLSCKRQEANGHANGHANGQARPRLILSARFTPGVAVPLAQLFHCLGPLTGDGMVTVQPSCSLASAFNLPLSQTALAAEVHGQKALTLFATVPRG
jgi:hypothetical protein